MSLRVWLPLNGSLENQGLDNITVTNNGAAVDNNGKIGKCYSFNGNNDYISLTGLSLYNIFKGGTQPFSITMWVYHADATRAVLFGDYGLSGTIGFNIELSTTHNPRFYWNATPDKNTSATTMILNTWTHLAIIYNGSKILFYKNGELTSDEYSGALVIKNKTSGDFYLGRDSRTGTTAFNGKLNDFRIYDHALSPQEIKKISQGLVLHYPLNRRGFGQENLYKGTKDFSGTWINSPYWTTSSETYKGFVVKQKNSVWGGLAQNIPCSNRDIFTISFYAKVDSGGNIISIHRSSLGNATTGLTILAGNFSTGTVWVAPSDNGTKWNWYWGTIQINSSDITYLQWRIENSVANKTLYICGIKLEKGSIPTPWCPNSSDALTDTLGLNDNIQYDASGYKNNGIKVGTFNYDSDTPKYNVSADFNGTDNCIQLENISSLLQDVFTINFWFKKDSLGSKNYETLLGGPSGFEMDTRSGSSQTLSLYMASIRGGNVYSPFNFGEWYMVTMVNNGINELYYINGILAKTIQKKSMPSGNYFIGAWQTNAKQNYKGLMSDFRIYATALSAEDVLSLYQNEAVIESDGTIRGKIR